MKYFEVFKAGVYPQGKFTKKQIAEIASNYDPKFCEAPITIDHQQSGPAYGWVQDVKAENDKLKVCFKDVPEEFEQEVNAGKYKKVSVELYRNLEGKGAYLKAVSFLGAAIPQVKGLESIKFMEAESDTYEFETEDSEDDADKFSQEEIDALKKQIDDLEAQVAKFKQKDEQREQKLETIKSLKDKINALTNEVASFKEKAEGKDAIERELNEIKTSLKTKEFNEFIDAQITKGILVPANKDIVLSVLQELDNVKKFGEDSPVIDGFKSFIESLPNQITYQELATKEKQAEGTNTEDDKFANADEDSLEIFKEAKALAAKENISFRDALLKLNI